MYIIQVPYHHTGLSNSEDTMDLARAVNAEIGRGGHVHPDSDEELQAAPALPVRQKRTREPRRKEVKTIFTIILKLKL